MSSESSSSDNRIVKSCIVAAKTENQPRIDSVEQNKLDINTNHYHAILGVVYTRYVRCGRVSFNLWLPVGRNKSVGFLAQYNKHLYEILLMLCLL